MKNLAIIISILLLCASAQAATTYVSQTAQGTEDGSSCANSKALTWANIGPHSADDTIYLCDNGGTLGAIDTPSAGSSGHPIVWEVASGESVTVTAAGAVAVAIDEDYNTFQIGSGTAFIVTASGADSGQMIYDTAAGTVIDGLTGHDTDGAVLQCDGCTGAAYRNFTFYDSGDGSEDGVLELAGAYNNILIERFEIYGDETRGIDGIQVTSSGGDNVIIRDGYIHDFVLSGGEGAEQAIDIKGGHGAVTISRVLIKNITDSHAIIIHTINGNITGTVTIEQCWIENISEDGIRVYPRNGDAKYIDSLNIISNVIVNTSGPAIEFGADASLAQYRTAYIVGNTLYNNCVGDQTGTCGSSSGSIYITGNTNASYPNYMINNIIEKTGQASEYLIWFNSVAEQDWTLSYNRGYDSDGTAQIDYGPTVYNFDDETFSNHEISDTSFLSESAPYNFRTSANITPANSSPGAAYDDGIDFDSDFSAVASGGVSAADRDIFNSGTWGKGAYVYGSDAAGNVRGVSIQ